MKAYIKRFILLLIFLSAWNSIYAGSLVINTSDSLDVEGINILIYTESEGNYYIIANYQCRSGEKIPVELPEEECIFVIADHPSYAPAITRFKASEFEDGKISIEKGTQILVEINDYSGDPIAGVNCLLETHIQPFGHRTIRSSTTDEAGRAIIKNLISNHDMDIIRLNHEISLNKEGYFTETQYTDIRDHHFELIPKNAIFGRVENLKGYPAAGINIILRDSGNKIINATLSGPDGKFHFILSEKTASGTFQLQLSSHRLIEEQTHHGVAVSKNAYIFPVEYIFAVQGTVVNESYDTVEEFYASLGVFYDDFRPGPNRRLFKDKDGRFCIGLGSHAIHDSYNYYIEIYSEEHGRYYQVIELDKGLNDLGELQLKIAPGIKGKVTDYHNSRPIKDVRICLFDERTESASKMNKFTRNCYSNTKTDENGYFRIDNVGGNQHKVLFEKEGYAPYMSGIITVPEDRDYDMQVIKLSKGNTVRGEIKARHLQEDEIDFSSMNIIAEDGTGLFAGEFRQGIIDGNKFEITMLTRGRYRIKLYYQGRRYYKYVTFEDECCVTEKIDIYIGGTNVSGYVYLEGEPISDTAITFSQGGYEVNSDQRPFMYIDPFVLEFEMYGFEKGNSYDGITDVNGKYTIEQVYPGFYIVEFDKFRPGSKLPTMEIYVEDVAYMQYDIHIKGAIIKLNIKNEMNAPVSAVVIVKPKNATDPGRYHFITSGFDGHAVIALSELGIYDIQVGGVDNYEAVYIEDIIIDAYEQEYEFEITVREKIIP